MSELFRVRHARPADAPFIGSHWVQAQQRLERGKVGSFSHTLDAVEAFPRVQHRIIDRLLASREVVTVVAHDPDDESSLFGFACVSGTHLHFVFVRPEMRGNGVAIAMLGSQPLHTCAAHWPVRPSMALHPGDLRLEPRPDLSWT